VSGGGDPDDASDHGSHVDTRTTTDRDGPPLIDAGTADRDHRLFCGTRAADDHRNRPSTNRHRDAAVADADADAYGRPDRHWRPGPRRRAA